ncbi:uncharacterized protein LOC121986356 isoform X1 [Zingiber officinale]|uniref:uncharacterized protein LOC121986356 isoform X1 n=1 Tax=Zingiber officinale TaxID=94328 RepID=UPI001C4ADC44|nr:uncharacterized protein LOC121986356 isoform X1 [Zingiber officinale]XP_042396182.1 uncharacterized protein LOC121986356 isoform X1 [Zingiber officinale]XP_042396183.1 uncharacterized protein LOC121986356 isoform X1 [Zingiber officinale]XP_042396184.1 uncharacterized protein LOC121986356 isoform X1 [Zingiber officinale]
MPHDEIPNMFGRVLSGTKYGLKQTRGKFGLGAKMARFKVEKEPELTHRVFLDVDIDGQHLGWMKKKLFVFLPAEVVYEVVEMAIQSNVADTLVWKPAVDGCFSLKSAWNLVRQVQSQNGVWVAVWSRLLSSNISIFVWRS